jgi:hypothetical protein
MQTLAPVIARRGHHKDVSVAAKANGVVQPNVRFTKIGKLTATDIDDVSIMLDRQLYSPGQIKLRSASGSVRKNRDDQSGAVRHQPFDFAAVLPEQDARNVGAMRSAFT